MVGGYGWVVVVRWLIGWVGWRVSVLIHVSERVCVSVWIGWVREWLDGRFSESVGE